MVECGRKAEWKMRVVRREVREVRLSLHLVRNEEVAAGWKQVDPSQQLREEGRDLINLITPLNAGSVWPGGGYKTMAKMIRYGASYLVLGLWPRPCKCSGAAWTNPLADHGLARERR